MEFAHRATGSGTRRPSAYVGADATARGSNRHHDHTSMILRGPPLVFPASRIPDPGQAPPIRWGVLAPGWIAGQFTRALHQHTRSRVVAVGSTSRDRADAFAAEHDVPCAYDSYEQLVAESDVDAVYVASPHSHHYTQCRLALGAGKPVLVEKAFTQNAAQAAELIDTAGRAGLLLMEAMWPRFLPHVDVIRQLLADGALGTVQTVISDHGQSFDIPLTHRLLNPDLAGGALLDLGVYPVSFTSFVLGTPDTILATATMTDTGVDGQVSAILRTGTAHGLVSASQLAKTPTTATISGTRARVEIGGEFYQPTTVRLTTRGGDTAVIGPGTIAGHEGLAYQAAHFAELLTAGHTESPLLPLAESLAIMQTMDEMRRQIGLVYPNERSSPEVP
jgi:predicted dehydrogenase